MKTIDRIQSDRIWALKAVAIFLVCFAHMPWRGQNEGMHKIFALLGIIGVPVFMFLSGYLDFGSKTPLPKRFKTLFMPVLIWASATFFVSCVFCWKQRLANVAHIDNYGEFLGGGISLIIRWICYCAGSRSVYYFVTVLALCMILSRYINKWMLVVLSICSIALSWDYLPHNDIFTRYLNPFNFLLYFQLGRLAREYEWVPLSPRWALPIGILICVVCGILWHTNEPSYFSLWCIPFSVGAFMVVDSLLQLFLWQGLVYIGKLSFVIYLSHIQIVGAINARMSGYWEYFKVPIAFSVALFFVWILYKFVNHIVKHDSIKVYLGFR